MPALRTRRLRRLAHLGFGIAAVMLVACGIGVALRQGPHQLRVRVTNIDDDAFLFRDGCRKTGPQVSIGGTLDRRLDGMGPRDDFTVQIMNQQGAASWRIEVWDEYTGAKLYDSRSQGEAFYGGPRGRRFPKYRPAETVTRYGDGRRAPAPSCLT